MNIPDDQKVWRFAVDNDEYWWPLGYVQGRDAMERVKAAVTERMAPDQTDRLMVMEVDIFYAGTEVDAIVQSMIAESDNDPGSEELWRRTDEEIAEEVDVDLLVRQINDVRQYRPEVVRTPSVNELKALPASALVAVYEYVDDVMLYPAQEAENPLPDCLVVEPISPGQVTMDDRGV
jgi:hypothetical protein